MPRGPITDNVLRAVKRAKVVNLAGIHNLRLARYRCNHGRHNVLR